MLFEVLRDEAFIGITTKQQENWHVELNTAHLLSASFAISRRRDIRHSVLGPVSNFKLRAKNSDAYYACSLHTMSKSKKGGFLPGIRINHKDLQAHRLNFFWKTSNVQQLMKPRAYLVKRLAIKSFDRSAWKVVLLTFCWYYQHGRVRFDTCLKWWDLNNIGFNQLRTECSNLFGPQASLINFCHGTLKTPCRPFLFIPNSVDPCDELDCL